MELSGEKGYFKFDKTNSVTFKLIILYLHKNNYKTEEVENTLLKYFLSVISLFNYPPSCTETPKPRIGEQYANLYIAQIIKSKNELFAQWMDCLKKIQCCGCVSFCYGSGSGSPDQFA